MTEHLTFSYSDVTFAPTIAMLAGFSRSATVSFEDGKITRLDLSKVRDVISLRAAAVTRAIQYAARLRESQ